MFKKTLSGCAMVNLQMANKNSCKIQSYVFLDLEATGIPDKEMLSTRVTEISLLHVLRDHLRISNGDVPRVTNKMTICVYPNKPILDDVVNITGLCNDVLEDQFPFDNNIVTIIRSFLQRCKKPICLIAHNGMKFDFPLLQAELNKLKQKLDDDVLCGDSLEAVKCLLPSMLEQMDTGELGSDITQEDMLLYNALTILEEEERAVLYPGSTRTDVTPSSKMSLRQEINEVTPKCRLIRTVGVKRKLGFDDIPEDSQQSPFKLENVYLKLFRRSLSKKHEAESDALALMQCIAKMGESAFQWFDIHSIPFNSVKKLW